MSLKQKWTRPAARPHHIAVTALVWKILKTRVFVPVASPVCVTVVGIVRGIWRQPLNLGSFVLL